MRRSLAYWMCLALVPACGGSSTDEAQARARPVTVLVLEEIEPQPGGLVPGVVVPYRQTEIGFDVAGRVIRLEDVGDDLQGGQEGADGEVLQEGDVIAWLDPERYQRAVVQAEQRLESGRLDLQAQKVNLEKVLEARLTSAKAQAEAADLAVSSAREDVKAAEAEVQLAETTLNRNRELLPSGAVSDIAVKQSETTLAAKRTQLGQAKTRVTTRQKEHAAALAATTEVEGSKLLQAAQIEAQGAVVSELEQQLAAAERDLVSCVLRAPFSGRLTALHVGEGSYVQPGSAVATLTMMNPIQVEVTASATEDELLVVGTDAMVYPTVGTDLDLSRGIQATLFEKQGIADEQTRTFRVGFIAANKPRLDRRSSELARVPYFVPVLENPLGFLGTDGLFTISDAIYRDAEGEAVLKVQGLSQGARDAEALSGELQAVRVPVQFGEQELRVASFGLIEIVEPNGLKPGDLVVPFPTAAHLDGMIIDDRRWVLRPGALVRVAMERGGLPRGFYVPVQAIRERNGETRVFVVEGEDVARAVTVRATESFGELRCIQSPELKAGMRLVTKGAHFLADGETLTIVSE